MIPFEEAKKIFESDTRVNDILDILSTLNLPDAWFVAGSVYRNLWNIMSNRPMTFETDIDIVFYDSEMTYDESERLNRNIREKYSEFDWELKNESVMHIRDGYEIAPYTSTKDAVSKFPEVSTAIGVRKNNGVIEWLAPYGFYDLAHMIVRPTPTFVGNVHFANRKSKKRLDKIYPNLVYKDYFAD